MARKTAFSYLRVSRGRAHRRNLEIIDQRMWCHAFARDHRYRIAEEFIEIELGKGADSLELRPELGRCIERARREGAPILVASIDRLARNVNFLATLLQEGVTFVITELDGPLRPMVLELHKPSGARKRPRADRRPPPGDRSHLSEVAKKGRAARREQADQFARVVRPEILSIQREGKTTLRAMATELNRRGIPTYRGAQWTPMAVKRVLARSSDES